MRSEIAEKTKSVKCCAWMEPHKNLWSKSGRENQAVSLVYLFVKITTLYFKVPLSTHISLSNFIKECIFHGIRAPFVDNVDISVPNLRAPLITSNTEYHENKTTLLAY